MDDEDGRCLLDVICDPQALNDFLHGSETHLDTDDLLDGSADPSGSFFSSAGGHVPAVEPSSQLSENVPAEVPSGSVDLDFLEDDDILGGSSSGGGNSRGVGTNHEPCDILQQSLAEANITEQSLQEAEAELDLGSFTLSGLTQVVQALPDSSLSGARGAEVGMDIEVEIGSSTQIFSGSTSGSPATPPNASTDMIGPVLTHPGLQLQPQGLNKAISVQPFMQQVGLGNVTLQPIPSLQALPNGSQSGHLGIGQIQVVGQPTVMAINQSGQPILAKTIGGYHLQQPAPEAAATCTQTGLGGSLLSSTGGGGLLIQRSKTPLTSPALNGASVGVSSTSASSSSSGSTLTSSGGLVGFSGASVSAAQPKPLTQGTIMQNIVIQRTPTPIQPKPPQAGALQPRLYKPQQPISAPGSLQNDSSKGLGVQQGQVSASAGQNVTFLSGKPGANVVLSAPAAPQAAAFSQALFKQQASPATGKPLSVHLLNQSGSIVIPSQAVLQGQNQFLLPQLQASGQILAQHPGGHIITSQGPNGQLIANQILATNQNLSLGQVLTSQGHSGTAHILSGPIQLQPSQMGHHTLFQMPVSLAQAQAQTQAAHAAGSTPTVIQGMPIQNSLAMLSQVEGLSPAVSLQPPPQQLVSGIPSNGAGVTVAAQCQPVENVAVLGSSVDQAAQTVSPPSLLAVQTGPSASMSVPPSTLAASLATSSSSSSSPSSDPSTLTQVPPQAQQSPGKLLLTQQGSSMILSHESLQMFLQQEQQQQKETLSGPLGSVPASVIVTSGSSSSSSVPPTSGHQSQSAETWLGQTSTPAFGPTSKIAGVYQIPSAGQQQVKVLAAAPSQPVATSTAPSSLAQTDSSQGAQLLTHQIQSPYHQPPARPPSQPQPPPQLQAQPQCQPQPQAQPSSRSCTPSSLPPFFIIHNQISSSPPNTSQTLPQQQPQVQVQLPTQSRPPSQPAPFQPDVPPSSDSPKPPHTTPIQFQFTVPSGSTPSGAPGKQQMPLQNQPAQQQQQNLQVAGACFPALASSAQSLPQQKQLLDRLQQVQHSIILKQSPQSLPQSLPPSQFSPQADIPASQIGTLSTTAAAVQLAPALQPTSVLVKTAALAPSELKMFSGTLGSTGVAVKQAAAPASFTQPVQTATLAVPFPMQPSKEARMLEQLRKQQGSVLHPDYSSPFSSFRDALQRLIPYHLYQGTPSSLENNRKVDEEFETVSGQLLKRTQAMLDKYRLLLFEESKRLGPSAEMVMIDRMFIMEEKSALNQERLLAKERPEEYAALHNSAASAQRPLSTEQSSTRTSIPPAGAPPTAPIPVLSHVTPTKLVIKHGGGSASVSWTTSSVPASRPSAPLTSMPANPRGDDDDDALPQRTNRPPMKTYEARRRIGLKLKIKQEAGLSKVVHNTALDPIHTQLHPQSGAQHSPSRHQKSAAAVPVETVTNRTSPCHSDSSPAAGASTTQPSAAPATSSASSSSSFSQVNGTLEHHGTDGCKQNQGTSAPPQTSCRLPLRKTYRENVSPPMRPGVTGGDGRATAHRSHCPPLPGNLPRRSLSPPAQAVIASVKVEDRGAFQTQPCTNAGGGGGAGAGGMSPPALMQELAEVEEAFNRGIMKKCPRQQLHPCEEEGARDEGAKGGVRGGGGGGGGSGSSGDAFVPTKRHKSDSPDMDNASFSSGSPPPDDSLNEHLQSAIDSILNLQQGTGRTQVLNPTQPPTASSRAAASVSQGHREGDFSCGQNGKFVSRTFSR